MFQKNPLHCTSTIVSRSILRCECLLWGWYLSDPWIQCPSYVTVISGSQGFLVEGVSNCSCHTWKKTANHELSALDIHILIFFFESPICFYQVDLHVWSWKLYLTGDKHSSVCLHARVAFWLFRREVAFEKLLVQCCVITFQVEAFKFWSLKMQCHGQRKKTKFILITKFNLEVIFTAEIESLL